MALKVWAGQVRFDTPPLVVWLGPEGMVGSRYVDQFVDNSSRQRSTGGEGAREGAD